MTLAARSQNILAISLICGLYGLLSIYGSIKDLIIFFTISSISQPILSGDDIFGKIICMENLFASPIVFLLFLLGSFMTLIQNKSGGILLFLGSLGGLLLYLQKYIWIVIKYFYADQIIILPSILPPIIYSVVIYILIEQRKVENKI